MGNCENTEDHDRKIKETQDKKNMRKLPKTSEEASEICLK